MKKILTALFTIIGFIGNTQTYYELDLSDATTYSTTCGTTNPSEWKVKNATCILTTSPITVTGIDVTTTVEYSIEVKQDGSMTSSDSAYVQHRVNRSEWVTDLAISGVHSGSTSYDYETDVTTGSTFQVRVKYISSGKSKHWSLENEQLQIKKKNVTMPIQLVDFHAKPDGDFTMLHWTTASEINNNFFTLEKSFNGEFFEEFAEVKGAGNSNSPINYESMDMAQNKSKVYYRLKQTDFDGKFTYSDILKVDKEHTDAKINVTNVNGVLYFEIATPENRKISIVISDASGRMIKDDKRTILEGDNAFSLKANIPANIIYFVTIVFEDKSIYSTKQLQIRGEKEKTVIDGGMNDAKIKHDKKMILNVSFKHPVGEIEDTPEKKDDGKR